MTDQAITFASLALSEPLLQALSDMQFVTPSAIQAQTIPPLLAGSDVVGQAQTGTGKTAAFALPILQRLTPQSRETQALVIAPTRELAIQVAEQCMTLGARIPGLTVSVLCGGQDYRTQLKQLRDGAQIVVGTPGRILDHLDRGTLQTAALNTVVLDEADEMLRMGFIEDMESILSRLPETRQTALFSATMPPRIRQIANRYLKDPVSVEIRMETATVKSIEQRFLFASQAQKPDALIRVLAVEDYQGVIVFVRTKSGTEEVAEVLQEQGMRAMAIHGDLTQALRERIIDQFRKGAIDILVATDVAARGLDVERVTHVINYDVPQDCETYVHRIGRTGRAGRSGVTILFVTPRESRMLNLIERHTRQRIEKILVPDAHTIEKTRRERFVSNVRARLTHEHINDYRELVNTLTQDGATSAVDIAAALALLAQQDKPWSRELPKPAPKPAREDDSWRREREPRFSREKPARFGREKPRFEGRESRAVADDSGPQELYRIDVGRIHGVKPGNIVGAIANEAGLQGRQIAGIKIHDDHTTLRLPGGMSKAVLSTLAKAWVCGRKLNLTSLGSA